MSHPPGSPPWHRDPLTALAVEVETLKKDVNRVTDRIERDERATIDALNEAQILRRDVTAIEKRLEQFKREYVLNSTFKPVKSIVYGLVAAILLAVIAGLMALLFGGHHTP